MAGSYRKKINISSTSGFTLIELMVVMAIIAVLAALVIGAVKVASNTSTETKHGTDAKAIQTGFEAYFAQKRSYPDWSNDPTWLSTHANWTDGEGNKFISFKDVQTELNADLGSNSVKLGSDPTECYNASGGWLTVYQNAKTIWGKSNKNYLIGPCNADNTSLLPESSLIFGP